MHTKASLILAMLKNNAVTVIAAVAAIITTFFVPPDEKYIEYFDFKTLTCLFCVLAVVCALRNIRFFYTIAKKIVQRFGNLRLAVLALVYITFIGSMLIANDMALLTFLPLGFFVLHTTGKKQYMAFTYIMQNIAANLGGMLTPFGNPQNLYLYSKFNIPDGEFILIMLPPFALSVALITLCCFIFIKPEPLELEEDGYKTPIPRLIVYLVLFALSILIVFRGIPYIVGLIVIPLALLFLDRRASKRGLRSASDLLLLLRFLGEYGQDRGGARVLLDASRKEHSNCERAVLPGDQQRALGHTALAVHRQLPRASARREYRRHGNANCVAGQPDNLPLLHQRESRQGGKLYSEVLALQFRIPRHFDPFLQYNSINLSLSSDSGGSL